MDSLSFFFFLGPLLPLKVEFDLVLIIAFENECFSLKYIYIYIYIFFAKKKEYFHNLIENLATHSNWKKKKY